MSLNFTKPEGCQAAAMFYPLPADNDSESNTITIICGDRRADIDGKLRIDYATNHAADMIVGFCVNCPNKTDTE